MASMCQQSEQSQGFLVDTLVLWCLSAVLQCKQCKQCNQCKQCCSVSSVSSVTSVAVFSSWNAAKQMWAAPEMPIMQKFVTTLKDILVPTAKPFVNLRIGTLPWQGGTGCTTTDPFPCCSNSNALNCKVTLEGCFHTSVKLIWETGCVNQV